MARHQRDRQRERTWRQHIRRHRVSGLTIRDYCFDHDLHESAFYFWRRTIDERDRPAAHLAPAAVAEPAFVPVTVVEAPQARTGSPIDINLAGGRRVRGPSRCDCR